MKIGIVTQPLLGNYGGLMQNFALQSVLRRLGHEPVTLDYIWSLRWQRYILTTIKTALLWFVPGRRRKFAIFRPVRENKKIDDFVRDHINTTEYIYRYRQSTLKKYCIDGVITGSDQVWRPMYNPDLKDMYLDFVRKDDIRRVAYAASFGTSEREYTSKEVNNCLRGVRRLDAVSVREASGIELCREYFGVEAGEVLDPTLLLTADDYCELSKNIPIAQDKYLGAYILDDKPYYNEVAHDVCSRIGADRVYKVIGKEKALSPIEWIAMFRDAEFIVTDSFHGTVFSIIFQKPFITFCNHSRGAERFRSLLAPLGLMNRLVELDNSDISGLLNIPIDWKSVSEKLNINRKRSINFLKETLG